LNSSANQKKNFAFAKLTIGKIRLNATEINLLKLSFQKHYPNRWYGRHGYFVFEIKISDWLKEGARRGQKKSRHCGQWRDC
jgi:hypothetical protein